MTPGGIPGVWMLDITTLCDFAAHVASETCRELGLNLSEEQWPVVAAAVEGWIDGALDRVAFAAETQAALDALPVVEAAAVHTPEFGEAAPLPLERRLIPPV